MLDFNQYIQHPILNITSINYRYTLFFLILVIENILNEMRNLIITHK